MSSVPAPQKAFRSAELIENIVHNEDIFELVFNWDGPAPKAGQFFLIRPKRTSVFLGRPISVFGWEADTCGSGKLRFLIARRGRGSAEMAQLIPGEQAELTGPLGKSWEDMPRPAEGQLALIGGGIGIAPLAAYAGELPKWEYDFYAGFKSSSYGLKGVQPKNLYIATEDGCEGCRGRIPDLLDPAKYGAVYACGPEPMLRAVAGACKKAEVPCFISMEKRMACGAGACLGCTVETTQGNKRCCADGPVFSAEEIIFND